MGVGWGGEERAEGWYTINAESNGDGGVSPSPTSTLLNNLPITSTTQEKRNRPKVEEAGVGRVG